MNKRLTLMLLLALLCIGFGTSLFCITPEHSVSVIPSPIMFSSYDYMIGGYNASSVKIIPDFWGGGVLTAFHGMSSASSGRKCFLAYTNANGFVQSLDSVSVNDAINGYPSMDFDEVSGMVFMAWHNQVSTDDHYSIHGIIGVLNNGVFTSLFYPTRILPPQGNTLSYLWPIVKFGRSPVHNMRRIYIMAKRSGGTTYPIEVPFIAYADFDPGQVTASTVLNWNYISAPQIESWALDTISYRRAQLTFVTGNDDKFYLIGHHTAMNLQTEMEIDEPKLDVWVMDNYGQGVWQRYSAVIEQPHSCQMPPSNTGFYASESNSTHFNAVLNTEGIIQFPSLYTTYQYIEGETYYLPTVHALRNVVFDTQSNSFRIDDLYPQGASPHSDPAYTPWDINEDGFVDEVDNLGNPVLPTTWPFNYWDMNAHGNSMTYYYNLMLLTEPNDLGWMACVWQDCNRSRLYNHPLSQNPELEPFAQSPEIFISLSPDNGWTWLDPVKLNRVETPALVNMKPMWVYPANKIVQVAHTNSYDTGRLYLMFYDDNSWGSYSLSSPIGLNNGGVVKLMGVDLTLTNTGTHDPAQSPQIVTKLTNTPNPFSTSTEISFHLAKAGKVNLDIYNVKGQHIKTLANSIGKAGINRLSWDAKDNDNNRVASGMYFYQLKVDNKTITKKLLLIK